LSKTRPLPRQSPRAPPPPSIQLPSAALRCLLTAASIGPTPRVCLVQRYDLHKHASSGMHAPPGSVVWAWAAPQGILRRGMIVVDWDGVPTSVVVVLSRRGPLLAYFLVSLCVAVAGMSMSGCLAGTLSRASIGVPAGFACKYSEDLYCVVLCCVIVLCIDCRIHDGVFGLSWWEAVTCLGNDSEMERKASK